MYITIYCKKFDFSIDTMHVLCYNTEPMREILQFPVSLLRKDRAVNKSP